MCYSLCAISKYIGNEKARQFVLPELKELLDDEEGEVVTEAIICFQKLLDKVFNNEFAQSDEALDMFLKLCDLASDQDMCLVDLGIVLKKLGKFITKFNRPKDPQILKKICRLITDAKQATFDDDARAMLPHTFQGICQIYCSSPQILIELYEKQLDQFLKKEIESGKPPAEQDSKNPQAAKKPVIYYDIMHTQKDKDKEKAQRENLDDQNFIVNR